MDRTQLYKIFRRVVETGGFSKAADQLQIPRSTVSTAISELENRLGVRLIQRTTRRLSITADGQHVYDQCCEILARIDEMEGQFRDGGLSMKGLIRVNVPGRIGRLVILPALPKFIDQYPEITVELGMSDQIVDLVESAVDCVVRVGTLADSYLIQRHIGLIDFVNVASPEYLARHGEPHIVDDLDNHFLIAYASPSNARIEPFEWTVNGVAYTKEMRLRMTVNSGEGLIAASLSGLGIIQIPRYDVKHLIDDGRLKEILPDFVAQDMPLAILYAHKTHISHRVRIFIDWIEQVIRANIFTKP